MAIYLISHKVSFNFEEFKIIIPESLERVNPSEIIIHLKNCLLESSYLNDSNAIRANL